MSKPHGSAFDLRDLADAFGEAFDARGFAEGFRRAFDLGGAGKSFLAGLRDGADLVTRHLRRAGKAARTVAQ